MEEKKRKKVLQQGAITADFIARSIASHSNKKGIGAHMIFLGQVRADDHGERVVKAIEYSAYEEMAEDAFYHIREDVFSRYKLTCMHMHHSLGHIAAGEICLFVFVSSSHRTDASEACREIVERIKGEVPVWGREIFDDESYLWKENK